MQSQTVHQFDMISQLGRSSMLVPSQLLIYVNSKSSISGTSCFVDKPPSARRTQAACTAPVKLPSYHHSHNNYLGFCVVLQHCIPLCGSHLAEQEFMGGSQLDHDLTIHQRSYVQSHSKGSLCCWRWQRRH